MGVAGVAGTFAPQEIAQAAGFGSANGAPLVIQLLAALLFGFAMVNWLARGSLFGGIYNRPLAVGNLAHFTIAALALVKAVWAGERRLMFLIAAAVYVVFALGFAAALFRSPVESK